VAIREEDRPVVVWFRRDLRLDDNPALGRAVESGRPIVPLVVDDPGLRGPKVAPRRVERYDSAVVALDRDLRQIGGRLIVRSGEAADVVPALVLEVGADEVIATRDLTPLARRRDAAVAAALTGTARLRLLPGTIVVEPEDTGEIKVFAAFFRRWQRLPHRQPLDPPQRIVVPDGVKSEPMPRAKAMGGPEALSRLRGFQADEAGDYARDRNRLDHDGTSRLSPDLHLGTISSLRTAATDSEAFVRQIAWRDWAHHLLWFARETHAGDKDGRNVRAGEPAWLEAGQAYDAWREGRTGYPTVDAGMRQLAQTGWIHNRARLIVASFLTKDLLLDWRLGEAHFLETLIDGDVANNRLGWRWTAGVGHDAAPFVRVLNPVLQGQRFDPHGSWVREWVPELRHVPDAFVHNPWESASRPRGYPPPIVNHLEARARALAAYNARMR
jgi:deoxyribodipyrimidine photo-lyase